ncbi:hypothetical protein EV192_111263 [Actinocrispum wychmicini]|uniref:Uncharacterized protein n=2 Tax=Actinocrispum wychmicini TaxID=1213861 RepID=A0A4R2J8W9_9PSEU|nr:hypothetical protein EV192_111263 [Actinocrispum wychmicini]
MEELTPFHTALAKNRDRYNARFRLARHRAKHLDANAFLAYLKESVGPAVDAAAAAGGDPVAVTDSLFDLVLDTNGRPPAGLGPLLAHLGRFVADAPHRVPTAMANALHHLDDTAGWASTMVAVAPLAPTTETLLDAGAVAAWRHGLAALRTSALAVARRVPPEILTAILDTSDVDSLAADPWFTPGAASGLKVVGRFGRFRGFGGTFRKPPMVFTSGGQWHATDGNDVWRVYADRFGTGFRRTGQVPMDEPGNGLTLDRTGTIRLGRATMDVPELAGATSWATSGNTLAATTPWTHAITFVAWTS